MLTRLCVRARVGALARPQVCVHVLAHGNVYARGRMVARVRVRVCVCARVPMRVSQI